MESFIHCADINAIDTADLASSVLRGTKNEGRVKIICPAGTASSIEARIRMYISRVRQKLNEEGVAAESFRLKKDIIPWTIDGKRHELLIFHREITIKHIATDIYNRKFRHG